MRRSSFVLATLLMTLACAPKSGGEDDKPDPIEIVDEDPGKHSLEWREDEDRLTTSPVSLTASDGTGLQLVSMQAHAVLEDPLAFTELTMVFRNPEDRVREGRFEINLPPGAAISRFAMKIDGKWQEAEVVERQAARRAYEDFLHRKQDPALLEKKAGNQFRARVFPIPANGVKELKVSYSQELRNSKEPYRVLLKGLPRVAALDVDVAIVQPSRSGMSSSRGGKASSVEHLSIHEKDAAPRADLEVRVENQITYRGLRHENLAVARVAPAMDLPKQPIKGLTVLLDTSASRALGFEGQVDRFGALMKALAAEQDFTLQVLCFDQGVEQVYMGSAKDFGDDAKKRIHARHPLGASDIEEAISWLHTGKDVQPRVLLVSDGIVTAGESDYGSLQESVARLQARGVERFDALVDGGIQDEATLRELTTAKLESAGIVASARMTQETLVHKLNHATRSGIEVSVPGAGWVWPQTLDGVQPGDEVLVYADLPAGQPMTVQLTAGKDKQEVTVPLRPAEGKLLERAWTQASLDRMTADLRGLGADAEAQKSQLKQSIIDVSTRKRVLSDYTALLVLETDADYQRFNIDRTALADILSVGPGGIEVINRSEPKENKELAKDALKGEKSDSSDDEAGGQGQRHRGEEGRMGKPTSKKKSGLYAMRGPEDSAPGGGERVERGAVNLLEAEEADEDVWGGLTGTEVGEAYGVGGLGLVGTGRRGGGVGGDEIAVPDAPMDESIAEARPAPRPSEEAEPEAAPPPSRRLSGGSASGSGYGRGSGAGFGGRGRRVPTVRQGRVTVQGSLDRDIIRRIVRAHINEIRYCYNQELTRNPNLEGVVTIDFVIDATGRVTSSSAAEGGIGNRNLESCVANRVRRWKFPKPPGGGTISVRYPFTFSSGGGGSDGLIEHGSPHSSPGEQPKAQDAWTGRYAEIMELVAKGEKKLAMDTAWHWRETEPGSELALLGLGDAAEANGDLVLASRAYGSLIDLFPSRADIRRMAGGRLERVAQQPEGPGLELVIDTYRQAVEQRADHPSSHRMYAFALIKAERHEQAWEAIMAGVGRSYPSGRFRGVDQILREDAGLIAAAWIAANPKDETRIRGLASGKGVTIPSSPSTRFVLNWETDANDVDFHIFDRNGGHASFRNKDLPSGGRLYADVTTGYGPECFTIEGTPRAYPYVLQGHYYSMGPMGYGMGKLQVIEHDGKGRLLFKEQPFVIMKNQAYVDLGRLDKALAAD
jgi:TonB family protein